MDDRTRKPGEVDEEALFSERVLLWLDQGERLATEAGAPPEETHEEAPAEQPTAKRGSLRRLFARHRLGVMAGMGLLPLALFAAMHHGSAAPVVPAAAIVAAPAPATTPASAAPVPAPVTPAPAAAVATAEPPAAEPEAVDEPSARQGRHRRHHHHHRAAHHGSASHR